MRQARCCEGRLVAAAGPWRGLLGFRNQKVIFENTNTELAGSIPACAWSLSWSSWGWKLPQFAFLHGETSEAAVCVFPSRQPSPLRPGLLWVSAQEGCLTPPLPLTSPLSGAQQLLALVTAVPVTPRRTLAQQAENKIHILEE